MQIAPESGCRRSRKEKRREAGEERGTGGERREGRKASMQEEQRDPSRGALEGVVAKLSKGSRTAVPWLAQGCIGYLGRPLMPRARSRCDGASIPFSSAAPLHHKRPAPNPGLRPGQLRASRSRPGAPPPRWRPGPPTPTTDAAARRLKGCWQAGGPGPSGTAVHLRGRRLHLSWLWSIHGSARELLSSLPEAWRFEAL